MTDVNFGTVMKARLGDENLEKAFCSDAMLARLHGRIVINKWDSLVVPELASR